jgi:hypothetical protein
VPTDEQQGFVQRRAPAFRPAAVSATWGALAVATAGTGYAATALPRNSLGTGQLMNNAVTAAKVKNGSQTGQGGPHTPPAVGEAETAGDRPARDSVRLGGPHSCAVPRRPAAGIRQALR